jgi:ABC-type glycerol-3-phosphate transport system permease component
MVKKNKGSLDNSIEHVTNMFGSMILIYFICLVLSVLLSSFIAYKIYKHFNRKKYVKEDQGSININSY